MDPAVNPGGELEMKGRGSLQSVDVGKRRSRKVFFTSSGVGGRSRERS